MKHYPAILLRTNFALFCWDHAVTTMMSTDTPVPTPITMLLLTEGFSSNWENMAPDTTSNFISRTKDTSQNFVWDAHADNLVRIEQENADLLISEDNGTQRTIVCAGIADAATGETVGDTSLFASSEPMADQLPFKGVFPASRLSAKPMKMWSCIRIHGKFSPERR